ncbi:sigma-70 family RNA polymerase sigma factor [Clostridium tagluense]|uniref:sigma-70 family RNA polymerase sigma factor n=1 Tax=Clostridium tagluense TaxID=360422 RepID=UPI001C0E496D|nr:sigma-70 family RNA polymerase sigma factor [Clostridium tagluense]MBU3130759.1 sigma-70 family RNA polymerase sigma factor [Clostridium tagluense]
MHVVQSVGKVKNGFKSDELENDKKIYSFVYNIVRNREEAMDITQDSFVKAIKYIHSYNSGKNFATWICTIEKNTNYDYLKKKSHNITASSIENEESM